MDKQFENSTADGLGPPAGAEPARLVLIRHGVTAMSMRKSFCGWLDPPLAEAGRSATRAAGALLDAEGLRPSHVFSSVLQRSLQTATIVAASTGFTGEIVSDWRLNERHYGGLQGREKSQVRRELGDRAFAAVHRSYRGLPPVASPASNGALQQWYDSCHPGVRVPAGESLEMVRDRVGACWRENIRPTLVPRSVCVVVAHSNSLRALIMEIESLDEDSVTAVDVPGAMPLIYDVAEGSPVGRARFLEPERARAAVRAMRREAD